MGTVHDIYDQIAESLGVTPDIAVERFRKVFGRTDRVEDAVRLALSVALEGETFADTLLRLEQRHTRSEPSGLKSLGSAGTTYKYDGADKSLLEHFPNPLRDPNDPRERIYAGDRPRPSYGGTVRIVAPEFTSLCPLTGQPDFATIVVEYEPRERCVESKAFKLYLGSFRQTGEFHEACVQRIANDLWDLLDPQWLKVVGEFTPRGGISFWPTVERGTRSADEPVRITASPPEFKGGPIAGAVRIGDEPSPNTPADVREAQRDELRAGSVSAASLRAGSVSPASLSESTRDGGSIIASSIALANLSEVEKVLRQMGQSAAEVVYVMADGGVARITPNYATSLADRVGAVVKNNVGR